MDQTTDVRYLLGDLDPAPLRQVDSSFCSQDFDYRCSFIMVTAVPPVTEASDPIDLYGRYKQMRELKDGGRFKVEDGPHGL